MSAVRRSRPSASRPGHAREGFTLVELLVVIGIIALLISILLPALSSARRQAAAVKCLASLREIGSAVQMYSIDNKGYVPPCRLMVTSSAKYNVDGHDYNGASSNYLFWQSFLAKYVTKTKVGMGGSTASEREQGRKNILWGCPQWDGYMNSSFNGGYYPYLTGYGWNPYPEYTASTGSTNSSIISPNAAHPNSPWTIQPKGSKWFKLKDYTMPTQRCLVADSLFWLVESDYSRADGSFPGLKLVKNAGDIHAKNGTDIDWYRHGKYPGMADANYFQETGGKVAYNILYADGHAATSADKAEVYRSTVMRFPGSPSDSQ
jgi:prepilin-type N-terminal cleavage/methylation domain-containing protein/prepilin-type processing-associated H-X9-DG protein